jgi:hypothetical protein
MASADPNPLPGQKAVENAQPPSASSAQVAGSAAAAASVQPNALSTPSTQTTATAETGHEWELPAIDVPGQSRPELREEDRVGTYGQPRWTAVRRFPTTRIYVIPEGKAEFEYWIRYTFPWERRSGDREIRSYYEMNFGLGNRLQMDIYLVTQQDGHGSSSTMELKREQVEFRYALADWGKVWGNPTLYLEWQHRNGENDWIEPKLLLGGEIAPGWHGGLNFVLEKELGGDNWENEYDIAAGVSRTIVDEKFHVGAEFYSEVHDMKGGRFKFGDNERLFAAGPSILLQPVPRMHMLMAPLFGKGSDGPAEPLQTKVRLWFVTGWTF